MFELSRYLDQRRAVVDAALDRELPAADERPARLHEAMRYSLFSGGKRLRPILCLAAAEATGADGSCALLPAIAVEVLHTYTLIHDDLPCMDNDDFRRGRPTVHRVFGEANAILAGDALQALTFQLVARAAAPAPYPPMWLATELSIAAGSRGVVGGQVEDMAAAGGGIDAATLDYIHRHKTADLFRASVRLGAGAAGAPAEILNALTLYGTNLGMAFQLTDDLLDAGDGADAAEHETSCLMVYSADEARARAQALILEAQQALQNLDPRGTEPLHAIAASIIRRTH